MIRVIMQRAGSRLYTAHIAGLVVALLVLYAPVARAQAEAETAKAEARQYLSRGDRALQRGQRLAKAGNRERANDQFERALAAYQKAYDAVPNPQIFFVIGTAEEHLGRYMDAYKHYRELLAASEGASAALRRATRERLKATVEQLAVFEFDVRPDGAQVFVDGVEVGVAPLSDPVVVEPGIHTVAIRHPGRVSFEKAFDVKAGSRFRKRVALDLVPLEQERTAVVIGDDSPPPPPAGRGWVIAGIGTAAALGATATVTGILALSAHSTYEDESHEIDERERARKRGRRLALTTDVIAGGAVAVGAATTAYYVLVYRPRRSDSQAEQTSATVYPYATGDHAGLVVFGSF